MASFKSIIGYGVLAQKETTYATASAFSAVTHAVLATDLPTMKISYTYDGARPSAPSTAGTLPFLPPSGRYAETVIVTEARGSGSAYSAATTPPDVHNLLQSCGLTGSYSAGAWAYVPVSASAQGESTAIKLFARGEQYILVGGRSTFSLGSDGASAAKYTFNTSGIMSGSVVDADVATITYNTTLPPKTENIGLTLGTFGSAIVRSFNLDYGRGLNPRVNINQTDAHAGYAGDRHDMKFNITIEAPASASFDVYELRRNATQFAATFTIGSVTGNKVTVSLPVCQIIDVTAGADGSVATNDLVIKPSSNYGTDDIVITYN
jgi:hypothetical protein